MNLWQLTEEMLKRGSLAAVLVVMATAGGVAVCATTMAMALHSQTSFRLRSARRRVRSPENADGANRAQDVASPWIPSAVASWTRPVTLRGSDHLIRVLAGEYARRIEERLVYEPAKAQVISETWGLATHCAGAACVVGVIVAAVLASTSGFQLGLAGLALATCGSLLGARAPWVVADRWLVARSYAAAAELPVLIDTVSLCTRAGMPFDQTLDLYSQRFGGELSHLLREAGDVWRSGLSSRMRELDRLSIRIASPSVESFFSAVIQSMELGTPLVAALDAQAAEVRAQRHAVLEERISKLPVKMLIPIGLFTLPAMLILLLAPIALQVLGGLA